jgi:hypothetical protein
MKTTTYILNKESEKALNVTMTVEGMGEVTTWLPKSNVTIADGTLTVKPAFWKHKELELRQEASRKADQGDVLVSGQYDEYEKSFGFRVSVYECMSEQSRRTRLFLPKSMCQVVEGGVKVAGWMLKKAVERCKEQYETNSFHASSMEVDGIEVQTI